ncbi:MAG: NUDIX domain-containing protein [Nitrosomonadaceae bacterium]|nr:NUDIX domain-containing protein [Nitrosomonadaceae bacterium]
MKQYVLGLLFDDNFDKVVLIEKRKPAFQAGKYNGVGGKIEPTDSSPLAAMVREFKEETGVDYDGWSEVAVFNGLPDGGCDADWQMVIFTGHTNDALTATTTTAEKVTVFKLEQLPNNIMPNLMWLIPLCLHHHWLINNQQPINNLQITEHVSF